MYIDTHAHLYLYDFSSDLVEVINRAVQNKIVKIIMPDISSETRTEMLCISEQHPTVCLPCIGLHPTSIKSNYINELTLIEKQLQIRSFISIGEIGIDKYWDTSYLSEQINAFESQLYLAIKNNLPVIIHQRNSFPEIFSVIKKTEFKGSIKGVFHCFSGTLEDAYKCIELGFFLGIGGTLTFRNSKLKEIVENIPLEYIVLESDAPYLAPMPYRGKRNEPSYIPLIAQKIAEIKNLPISTISQLTTKNALTLFDIK